jgi:hypothetical protein
MSVGQSTRPWCSRWRCIRVHFSLTADTGSACCSNLPAPGRAEPRCCTATCRTAPSSSGAACQGQHVRGSMLWAAALPLTYKTLFVVPAISAGPSWGNAPDGAMQVPDEQCEQWTFTVERGSFPSIPPSTPGMTELGLVPQTGLLYTLDCSSYCFKCIHSPMHPTIQSAGAAGDCTTSAMKATGPPLGCCCDWEVEVHPGHQ